MKAIIFGGSGFLGSHVVDTLWGRGFETVVYDIVKSKHLVKGQEMIVGDILDKDKVKQAVKGCDYVYNFAGIADIEQARREPLKTIEHNTIGTTYILEACCQHRVKRFVFASSIYVYSQLAPFYRSSKQACELIIEDYQKVYGLDYTILRYGSLYGKRANPSNFIYRVIKQAMEENKITRIGDGEEIREYIHAVDAAKSSVDILSDEFKNQHVIITGTQSMKIKDLLMMVKEILNRQIDIEYLPGENADHYEITPYTFRPTIAKKLVSNCYHDLGQGLLDVAYDMYGEAYKDSVGKNRKQSVSRKSVEVGLKK